jgi:hypothetical protein
MNYLPKAQKLLLELPKIVTYKYKDSVPPLGAAVIEPLHTPLQVGDVDGCNFAVIAVGCVITNV